jgi:hypothetical protein
VSNTASKCREHSATAANATRIRRHAFAARINGAATEVESRDVFARRAFHHTAKLARRHVMSKAQPALANIRQRRRTRGGFAGTRSRP